MRHRGSMAAALLIAATAGAAQALPWDMKALSAPPATYPTTMRAEGVTGVFYDGLPWKGKATRIFAWYGLPELRPGEKAPGMVLVHGGGGTAFAEWVRLWIARGYAAIAMDTCGAMPVGSYGKWKRHEYGGPPGWGGFDQIDDPPEDQWPYHAVAAVILGHSLLRSMPQVDSRRIGITGISWGGYLTCIVAGVDDRFALAVPVYGCGFLGDNSCWLPQFQKMGDKATKWLKLWDPSVYLPRARMPMLWVTGTNDFAYPLDSLQKSYRAAPSPRTLCIRLRMPHGHGGPGEKPEEIHVFANSVLRGGTPLARITDAGERDGRAWVAFDSAVKIVSAEMLYTCDTGPWQKRKWQTTEASLDSEKKRAEAKVPAGTTVYYINLIDERGLVVSGEHVVTPAGSR